MLRLTNTFVLLLLVSNSCFASVQFALSDVSDFNWKILVTDSSSGVASGWSMSGVAASGDVLSIAGEIWGMTSSPATVDFEISSGSFRVNQVTSPLSATLNGAALQNSVIKGSWTFSGPTIQSPISVQPDTSPGALPGSNIPARGSVDDIPVTFDVDFSVFASANDTTPAYQLSGSGTGNANADFATLARTHDRVLQTGTEYNQLTVNNSGAGAVPEPASILVWSLFAIGGLVAYRRRRSS